MFRGARRATQGGGGGSPTLGWVAVSSTASPYTLSTSSGINSVKATIASADLDIMLPSAAAGVGLIYTVKHTAGSLTLYSLTIKSLGGNVEGNTAGVGVRITANKSTTRISSDGSEWLII